MRDQRWMEKASGRSDVVERDGQGVQRNGRSYDRQEKLWDKQWSTRLTLIWKTRGGKGSTQTRMANKPMLKRRNERGRKKGRKPGRAHGLSRGRKGRRQSWAWEGRPLHFCGLDIEEGRRVRLIRPIRSRGQKMVEKKCEPHWGDRAK